MNACARCSAAAHEPTVSASAASILVRMPDHEATRDEDRASSATRKQFAPIRRDPNLPDKVTAALTESIVSGELKVGERLPAERKLMEQFGVSRTVVREAVRSVIAKGLATSEARRGHVVAARDPQALSESISLFLRGRGSLDLEKLSEVRATLEVEIAGHAAERASAADVAAIASCEKTLDRTRKADDAARADVAFHREIARATGNEYYVIMLDSIRDVLVTAQIPGLANPRTREYVRGAHRVILEAIAAGDPEGARSAMREHLAEAARRLSEASTDAPGTR
jgi:GntR family transcriptional regulator, transcriptional repressor for pyruvate dehydrogenase complex